MTKLAYQRLKSEYRQLLSNSAIDGISAEPINDNLFEWKAVISGPSGTCFEGGKFETKLTFPKTYPFSPPVVKFLCEMFHPNIFPDGLLGISILHTGALNAYTREPVWSPVQNIRSVLLSVLSMLSEPNLQCPANVEAARLWVNNTDEYNQKVRTLIQNQLQN